MIAPAELAAPLRGRRILVTGAGGFLGGHLCRALAAVGATVAGTVRPGSTQGPLSWIHPDVPIFQVELTCPDAVADVIRTFEPEGVLHAAVARPHAAPHSLRTQIVDGALATATLLDAVADVAGFPRRLVLVGSTLAVGPRRAPIGPQSRRQPSTARGADRAACEIMVEQQHRAGRVDGIVLRIASVYGPHEPSHRLVPSAIRAALTGTVLPLTSAAPVRDLVFVDDVVEACLRALVAPSVRRPVVIGTGVETSNEALVHEVARLTGRRIEVDVGGYPPGPFDAPHWHGDPSSAAIALGWTPRHDVAAGLERTIAWWRTHLE